MTAIKLPTAVGHLAAYRLSGPCAWVTPAGRFNRVAFAAAHVVADPGRAAARMRKVLAVHGIEG
jgi:hypothetical protein